MLEIIVGVGAAAVAIQKLIRTLESVDRLTSSLQARRARRDAAHTGQQLAALVFPADGSRKYLTRIASGKWDVADVQEVSKILKATADEVVAAIQELERRETWIGEHHGLDAAHELRAVVTGPAISKLEIRRHLAEMITLSESVPLPRQEMEHQAQQALQWIEELNSQLFAFHNRLLGPASKASTPKKRSASSAKKAGKKR